MSSARSNAIGVTAAHPEPVILVHGTFENMFDNWQAMSGLLGIYGVGPIERSAQELATEIDAVLAQTGASRVDLVGHSQGGMMPRYYLKNVDATKVDDLVGLSPSNHGTTNGLASPIGGPCPACAQQAAGSSFITQPNAGDETPGSVDYTNISTRYDEVVTPYTSAGRSGPADPSFRPACVTF